MVIGQVPVNSLVSARAASQLPEPRLADVHLPHKTSNRETPSRAVCVLCRGWCVCVSLSHLEFAFPAYPTEIDLPPEASTEAILTQGRGDPLSAGSSGHQTVLVAASLKCVFTFTPAPELRTHSPSCTLSISCIQSDRVFLSPQWTLPF